MFRVRSSRDSDSQVKSGCSHLIRDGLTLYLGFLVGVRGRAPADKNRKSRSSKLPKKQSSILAPPIYFCYLFSFKSFTVPLGGLFFEGGGGGVRAGLGQHDMTATSEV